MSKKNKAIVCNVFLVILEIIALIICFKQMGLGMFYYFTILSNILCLVSSLVYLLVGKNKFSLILRYSACVCLTLTFVVVIFILIPQGGGTLVENIYALMIDSFFVFMHLLCPLLTFVSFVFYERDRRINKRVIIWGMLPMLIYGTLMYILNFERLYCGPYPFLLVYQNPWWLTLACGVGIGLFDYLTCLLFTKFLKK